MPRFVDWKKNRKVYDYKVCTVDTIEQELLDELSNQWYELDYVIAKDTLPVMYLIFRRYADE